MRPVCRRDILMTRWQSLQGHNVKLSQIEWEWGKKSWSYTGDVVCIAGAFWQQSVADLPSKYARTLSLIVGHFIDDPRCGHSGLGASDGPGLYRPCLIVSGKEDISYVSRVRFCPHKPAQDLGYAAVGDLQDARDVAGPGAAVRQLHDLLPGGVGQRPAVDVDPAQLVHPAVPWNNHNVLTGVKGFTFVQYRSS